MRFEMGTFMLQLFASVMIVVILSGLALGIAGLVKYLRKKQNS